jgi:hypothetical protein
MEDDLNTPEASGVTVEFAINLLETAKAGNSVYEAQHAVREMGNVFGLQLGRGLESRVVEGWGKYLLKFKR